MPIGFEAFVPKNRLTVSAYIVVMTLMGIEPLNLQVLIPCPNSWTGQRHVSAYSAEVD